MINNCTIKDIDTIINLGRNFYNNFDKLNNINELIENNNILGYYNDNKLVGMLIFNKLYETIDILYLIVDENYRRKHIASNLLEYLINNYEFYHIMLEVNINNINAINLYKKYNFKIINIRKKYYQNIDAYQMELIK